MNSSASLPNRPLTKLANALIGKSILEAVLLGTLAFLFFIHAFPQYFRGSAELSGQKIAGWATNNSASGERVTLQLFVDGKFVASGTANEFRPDVREAGWAADDWHGFSFGLPALSPGKHVARVYVLHESGGGLRQTLQLLGSWVEFVVNEHGNLTAQKKQ
jgi:hypothetical protein